MPTSRQNIIKLQRCVHVTESTSRSYVQKRMKIFNFMHLFHSLYISRVFILL